MATPCVMAPSYGMPVVLGYDGQPFTVSGNGFGTPLTSVAANGIPASLVDETNVVVGPAFQAMQPLMSALAANALNVAVVGAGDSITATPGTSYYNKWWALLAAQFPAYTFRTIAWNDVTSNYSTTTVLSTGTGPNFADLYNCSVSGTAATYLLGDKLFPALTGPGASLILCSYGANHVAPVSGAPPTRMFYDFIGNIRKGRPTTQIILIGQPPNRDNENQADDMAAAKLVARTSSVGYIPIYERFLAAGRPPSFYTDAVHPNSAGGDFGASVLMEYSRAVSVPNLPTIDLFTPRGDLFGFNKTATGWNLANVTASTTTTAGEFETGGQALKLVTTTPAASVAFAYKEVIADATPYRGGYLTLLSRQRAFAGSSLTCGRHNIYTAGPPSLTEAGAVDSSENVQGTAFTWKSLTMLVPQTATNIRVYFYTSAINESGTLCIDQAYLVPGIIPGTS